MNPKEKNLLRRLQSVKQRISFRQSLIAASALLVIATVGFVIYFQFSKVKDVIASSASANLNQTRNGTDSISVNPMAWVNGNIGMGTAHYVEEWSIPYQCLMTGLTSGAQVTLTIGYDIRNSSKNAIDFLTHYNRVTPHNVFTYHSTAETIDPLSGTGLASNTTYSTYTIPAPSSSGSTVSGQPTASFNSLTASEKLMTLYNGTIDTIYYVSQGSLTATSAETQVAIKFTPSASTAVLLWGGHLAGRGIWGFTSGAPNSAGGISGSPFHSRLISWSLGSLGSSDRSVAGAAVSNYSTLLPITLVSFDAKSAGNAVKLSWSTGNEINNDFFTIERSEDGKNFSPLSKVNGAGNSTSMLHYSASDEKPLPGINYYRLRQTDYDGKFTTSEVEVVKFDKTKIDVPLSIESIGPNPFTKNFNLIYTSESEGSADITLRSSVGSFIKTQTLQAKKGLNTYQFVNDINLQPGIYYVTLTKEAKAVTKKIMKS